MKLLIIWILALGAALSTGCRTVTKSQLDQKSTKDSTGHKEQDSAHLVRGDSSKTETVDSAKLSTKKTSSQETVTIILSPKATGMDTTTGKTWTPDPVHTIQLVPGKNGGYKIEVPDNATSVVFDLNHSQIDADSAGYHSQRASNASGLDSSGHHADQDAKVTTAETTRETQKKTRGLSLFVGLGCLIGILVLIVYVVYRIERKLKP